MEDQEDVFEQAELDPSKEEAERIEQELERALTKLPRSEPLLRDSPLGLYLGLRNTYAVIRDHETFRELFIRYQQADGDAKHKLASEIVYRNLGLVISIARFYKFRGVPTEDLYQVGMIALYTKALEKYDPNRDIRFSTYATWWIRHAMAREIADRRLDRPFRTPVHFQEKLSRLRRFCTAFEQMHHRPPTPAELSEYMGSSESDVIELLQDMERDRRPKSLYWQVGHDDTTQLIEVLKSEEESGLSGIELVQARQLALKLKQLMDRLPTMQQTILHRRFALGTREETLKSIGDSFNLSRERVRQLEQVALKHLSKLMQISIEQTMALIEYSNETGLFIEETVQTAPALLEINDEQAEEIYAILQQHSKQRPSDPYPRVISPVYTLTVRMDIPTNQAQTVLDHLRERGWVSGMDAEGHADLIRGLPAPERPAPPPPPPPPSSASAPPPPPAPIVRAPLLPPRPPPPLVLADVPPAPKPKPAPPPEEVIRLNSDRHEFQFEGVGWSDLKALHARLRKIDPSLNKKRLEHWVEIHARSRLVTHDENGRKRTLYHREELRDILISQVSKNLRT